MANRHKRAKGGRTYYDGGESNVASEAAEKKRGGGMSVSGKKGKGRLDKRARGGRTGSPFSSARMSEKGNLT